MVDQKTAGGPSNPAGAGDEAKVSEPMYDLENAEHKKKMLDLLDRCQRDARSNTARLARDRADLLNLRMEKGGEDNQWLVWDGSNNTYVPRPTEGDAGLPPWFFRATSNLLSNKIDGICGILNQSQPAKNWFATREDEQSTAAAEVAELADPVLLEEIDYPHMLRPRLNKLVTLTNLAALVLTYDTDPKWGLERLPALLCQNPDCRQMVHPLDAPDPEDPCPECGGPLDFAPDPRDQSGMTPLGTDEPKGRIDAELLTSFETSLPKSAAIALETRNPWISTHQRWAPEDALSRWPQLRGHLEAKRNAQGGGKATEQAYADQAKFLSAPVQPGSAQNVAGSASYTGPVIWRLWHDPIEDEEFSFPDGLFLTVLEGEDLILDGGPLPFKDDDDRPIKNVLIRQYAPSAGSPWGKPPADDLVPLQKQLNLAQSLAFLILMHNASPRTFIPSTVTLHDQLTGMPGKDIGYRSLVPGDKPHVEPGTGFPEALKWFLEFLITTFDTVSKLNAVLMGQRPTGDPTLGEVQILQERGFAAFQEPLEQLVSFERRLSMLLLHIARQSAWAPRFRRMLDPDNGEWQYKSFTGADLEGHVTVDIELASAWPKSPLLTNLRLTHALELGILNPQDPEVAEEYLRLNDLQDFKKSTDMDSEQIARQLEVWREAVDPGQIEPPQMFWRLDIHLFRKSQFLKSERFEQLRAERPLVAEAMMQHIQLLQALMAPPVVDQPAEPGKGEKGALDGAVKSGAIAPARGKGGRGALAGAVKGGALQPAGTGQAQSQHQRKQAGGDLGGLVKSGVLRPAGVGRPGTVSAGNPAGAR